MNYKYTRNIVLGLLASIIIISCGPKKTGNIDEMKAEVEKLKTERSKITDQIKVLQDSIVKKSGGEAEAKAKEVAVTALAPRTFDHTLQTQGNIESLENILLSAKTPGLITQVYVVEGQSVQAGQVLGQVDNSIMLRGIDEIKSNLDLAKTVYDRQKNLWDQKIGTEVQYLQAKANKESLERRMASMNEQIENTKIKSPINGVVDAVNLRVGENINPGMPAARIVNNENLKVKANISESYIAQIKKGNKVLVTLPDINKTITAPITFVGRNINAASRTFVAEVKLPSSSDISPNMSAVIRIVFESVNNALVVPVNVVQDINGQKVVYIAETVGKQTKAKRVVVQVGGIYDNFAQITGGLKAGDQVITSGYSGLNDGELVKI